MADHTLFESTAKLKRCSQCKAEKPLTEFWAAKGNRDGLTKKCRSCIRLYQMANRDRTREYGKRRWKEKKEELSAQKREYYASHKDEAKAWGIEYRKRPGVAERQRETGQRYYQKNKEKIIANVRRWGQLPESRKAKTRQTAELRQQFPEKYKARTAVLNAVRDERLFRPSSCSECGKQCRPEGHHHKGYEPEHYLDVVWLCKLCHVEADKKCP